jgi:hypothetical protein
MSNRIVDKLAPELQRKCSPSLLAAMSTDFSGYQAERTPELAFEILFYLASSVQSSVRKKTWQEIIYEFSKTTVSRLSTLYAFEFENAPYGTAKVNAATLKFLLTKDEIAHIDLAAQLKPLRAPALPLGRSPDDLSKPGDIATASTSDNDQTLLGLIDFGFPFAHEQYLNAQGKTRIQAIWDQDTCPEFDSQFGSRPNGFHYGRQVNSSQINQWLEQRKNLGISEGALYQLAACPSMASRVTHGSGSLSILAANQGSTSVPNYLNTKCDSPIVLVQIPYALPLAPCAGAAEKSILDGIAYIITCANGKFKKIVISLGYGSYLGPHDGSTFFEKALEFFVAHLKKEGIDLHIVFASGNGFDKAIHASSPEKASERQHIDWWLPPQRDSLVFADAWLRSDKAEKCRIGVISPSGKKKFVVLNSKETLSQVSFEGLTLVARRDSSQKVCVFFQMSVTAASGRWSLFFELAESGHVIHVNTSWGGRNPAFLKRTQQCKFLKPQNILGATALEVTGEGSVISTACNSDVWLVGGYELWQPYSPSKYSGGGLAHGGVRAALGKSGVDILAPCEQSPSLAGLLCNGTRSASWIRENGTSVSAPLYARQFANSSSGVPFTARVANQLVGPYSYRVGQIGINNNFRIRRGEILL